MLMGIPPHDHIGMAGDPFTIPLNAIRRRVAYAHHIRITLERAPHMQIPSIAQFTSHNSRGRKIMNRNRSRVAAAILGTTLTLAGCSGSGANDPADQPQASAASASARGSALPTTLQADADAATFEI